MTKKISLSIFIVSLLTLLLTLSISAILFNESFKKGVERDLSSEAKMAAHAVSLMGEEYFDSLDTSNRISWISADGDVLYDSHQDPELLGSHADREEFIEAISDGVGISKRYSDTLSTQTFNYALRLDDGSVIRVSSTQHTSVAVFIEVSYYIAIFCIIMLCRI